MMSVIMTFIVWRRVRTRVARCLFSLFTTSAPWQRVLH